MHVAAVFSENLKSFENLVFDLNLSRFIMNFGAKEKTANRTMAWSSSTSAKMTLGKTVIHSRLLLPELKRIISIILGLFV